MDYLNPDSLLKPTNAENSIYAPSFDQMLMAETKRGLMADELASNLNERNQNARILERYKLPMEMAKSDYELAEAQRKNSPEYLDAMIKGYIGDSQAKQAQGSKAMGTLEKDIALANMTNDVGIGQAEVLKQYAPLYRLNQKISTVMSSVPANKQQPYLKKILQDHFSAKENVNWLDPSYQKMLDDLTKDPRKLNNFITGQLNNVINQPQNFEWNKLAAELEAKKAIAANENATRQAIGRSETKKEAQIVYEDFMATDPKFKSLSPDERWRRVYEAMSYRTPASQPLETREGWVKVTQPDGSVKWEKVTTKEPEKSAKSTPATNPAKANVTCAPGFVYDPTKDACVKGK